MLGGAAADMELMGPILKWASLICCLFMVLSFGLFAEHQVAGAATRQAAEVETGQLTSRPAAAVHKTAQPRRFINGVAGDLTSPFSGVISSDNAWVRQGIPTLLGLLVYGFGLGYLARWSNGRSRAFS
jgi:hypothetical protein